MDYNLNAFALRLLARWSVSSLLRSALRPTHCPPSLRVAQPTPCGTTWMSCLVIDNAPFRRYSVSHELGHHFLLGHPEVVFDARGINESRAPRFRR